MVVLVTGATGNVGQQVVAELLKSGTTVRCLSRNPDAKVPAGAELVVGDLSQPETLSAAFEGVDSLFLFPLAYLKAQIESFDDVIVTTAIPDVAKRAGVRRIVLLSSNAVVYGQDQHHQDAEKAVVDSGLEWTLLRPGEFATNRLLSWGHSIRENGEVRSGFPDVMGAPIHESDVAAVAVAALTRDDLVGLKIEMTGPAALTEREQVAALAKGAGRDIQFVALTPDQARAEWVAQGIPAEVVDEMMSHYHHHAAHPPQVHDAVAKFTGRPARTLADWAADHADAFA